MEFGTFTPNAQTVVEAPRPADYALRLAGQLEELRQVHAKIKAELSGVEQRMVEIETELRETIRVGLTNDSRIGIIREALQTTGISTR